MKKRILKGLIVLVLIVVLTMTNFVLVGTGIISYALDNITTTTNNKNVEFSTYFVSEEKKVDSISLDMASTSKLYLEISVKNEGYITDGIITLAGNNFEYTISDNAYVKSVNLENDTIALNQIDAGKKVILELNITPSKEEKFDLGLLSASTKISMTGKYVAEKGEIQITSEKTTREIKLNWICSSNKNLIENNIEVVTNKVLEINGEAKRIIQVAIDLGLKDNEYPIKNIVAELSIPSISEKNVENVESFVKTYNNTNKEEMNSTTKQGITTTIITMTNESNNNIVNWKREGKETIILTYTYPADVEIKEEEIIVKQVITLHDGKQIASDVINKKIEAIEKDAVISIENINLENSIYKGSLLAGIDRKYTAITKIDVSVDNSIADINEKESNATDQINVFYEQTKINKKDLIKVIGQHGQLIIKNQDLAEIAKITNETVSDEDGNIIVDYNTKAVTGIQIEVKSEENNYLAKGSFELEHIKLISDINTAEVKKANKIENEIVAKYNTNKDANIENKVIELKDTKTEAIVNIDKTTLTTLEKNEDVKITATLISNGEEYNLYKNPSLEIILPKEVKEIDIKSSPDILYANGELKLSKIQEEKLADGRIVIKIELSGEQTKFANSISRGIDIQLTADLTLDILDASAETKIEMNYKNQNGEQTTYSTNKVINIASRYGIFVYNTVSAFNKKGETGVSKDDSVIAGIIDANSDIKKVEINRTVINNYEKDVTGISIIGSLVSDGIENINGKNVKSNFAMMLSSGIVTSMAGAKVYYSLDEKATSATTDWTENYENAKSYKIVLPEDTLKSGEKIGITLNVEIPEKIDYIQYTYEKLNIEYNYSESLYKKVQATYFETGDGSSTEEEINQSTKNQNIDGIGTVGIALISGKKVLAENEEVFEGQTIKYRVTITNTTGKDLNNIKLNVNHENANVYDEEVVKSEQEYIYIREQNKSEMILDAGNIKAGEAKVIEYQVAVKENVTTTSGIISISADNIESKSVNTVKTNVKQGDLKLVLDDFRIKDYEYIAGARYDFGYEVTNISDTVKENVEVYINIPEALKLVSVTKGEKYAVEIEDENYVKVIIPRINSRETITITLDITSPEEKTDTSIETVFTAKLNNKTYISNEISRGIFRSKAVVDVNLTGNIAENSELKTGDKVTFTATIKNTGNVSTFVIVNNNLPLSAKVISAKYEYNGQVTEIEVKNNSVDFGLEEIAQNEEIKLIIETEIDENKAISKILTDTITVTYLGNNVTKKYSYVLTNVVEPLPDDSEDIIIPEDPDNTEDPNNPDDSTNPSNPSNPSDPSNPDEDKTKTNVISGHVWLDENKDGKMDDQEPKISGVTVLLIDENTSKVLTDTDGNIISRITEANGKYKFTEVPSGKYILAFECDMSQYGVTEYKKQGVSEEYNSDVISKKIVIDEKEITLAVTDVLNVTTDKTNINAGLIENPIFDLSLRKNINKITVQNSAGTIVKEYENVQLAKIEIHANQISGSTVLVEYQFVVTNEGEIAGYVNDLVDNLPDGMKFNSEINKDWYLSTDGKLHTAGLSDEIIKPGESKAIKLTLIKTMTSDNKGLTLNTAEIVKSSNDLAIKDYDSTSGNNKSGEDDISSAQLIIAVKTGADTIVGITSITIVLVALGIFVYIIKRREAIK